MFGNTAALANTFAGGIPEPIPYTNNGVVYDRYIVISRGDYSICSNTMAFYFVSSEMTSAGYPSSGNKYSLVLGYPSNIPSFNTIPNGAHMAIFIFGSETLFQFLAEAGGFEPPIRLPVYRISSAAYSTSLARFRISSFLLYTKTLYCTIEIP